MKIKTVIATTGTVSFGDTELTFTAKNFEDMVKTMPGKPITVEFDQSKMVGTILSGEVIDGKLIATIDIDEKKLSKDYFCVPSVQVPGYTVNELSLTKTPLQKNLTHVLH